MASSYDGHASKRLRTDFDGHGIQSGKRDNFEDAHKAPPSSVVHVRGLSHNVLESDLVEAVQHFGPISYVLMLTRKRQALIEFEDIQGARSCVEVTQNKPIYIGDCHVFFNYSTSHKIQRPNGEDQRPNTVLLLTVLNPQYPITVDVMHTICNQHGQVLRIVIFKKNGVQAMVEFDSLESAHRAKKALNGADIYSGCCTLKIEYAKPTRLNVVRNDSESYDFTIQKEAPYSNGARSQPLLADPRYTSGPTPYRFKSLEDEAPVEPPRSRGHGPPPAYGADYDTYGEPYGRSEPPYMEPRYGGHHDSYMDRHHHPAPPHHHGHHAPPRGYPGPPHDGPHNAPIGALINNPGMLQQGAVLMVYGLDMEKMNCTRVFNMFCLYGNVVRVKFLKSKEGSAMVQMGDKISCDRAMKNLNGIFFFGNKIMIGNSKQMFLQDVPNPHDLPDGTASFTDFMGNRNNRFTTAEAAQKNRIQPPSKILHYFNAPPRLDDEGLKKVFEEAGAKAPIKSKQFPAKSDKSSTGLVEWENKAAAMEALVLANHHPIENPGGKNPYTMKLCFSPTAIVS